MKSEMRFRAKLAKGKGTGGALGKACAEKAWEWEWQRYPSAHPYFSFLFHSPHLPSPKSQAPKRALLGYGSQIPSSHLTYLGGHQARPEPPFPKSFFFFEIQDGVCRGSLSLAREIARWIKPKPNHVPRSPFPQTPFSRSFSREAQTPPPTPPPLPHPFLSKHTFLSPRIVSENLQHN